MLYIRVNPFQNLIENDAAGCQQPGARAHTSLLQLSIFGLSATDKKGFQNTGR